MTLTQEQIQKLASNLSKINSNDPRLESNINGILKYIDLLEEVDTTDVEPTISVVEKINNLRIDEETKKAISREALLGCSNQKIISDQIAVSSIMK